MRRRDWTGVHRVWCLVLEGLRRDWVEVQSNVFWAAFDVSRLNLASWDDGRLLLGTEGAVELVTCVC